MWFDDINEGRHVNSYRSDDEDEEGGAGTTSGASMGCTQRIARWHDLHGNVRS